jgi:hypothetical protein
LDVRSRSDRRLDKMRNFIIYTLRDIIMMIKVRRMRWTEHVARTMKMRSARKIFVGKPEGKSTRKTYAQMEGQYLAGSSGNSMGGCGWIHQAQDKDTLIS